MSTGKDTDNKGSPAFRRFEDSTKRLLSVPKKEAERERSKGKSR